jgi:predicted RecB family nuclease
MQMLDGGLVHSASDLNAFTECLHLVALERQVAAGECSRPQRVDPAAELLARKGNDHEQRYLARLRERHGDRLVAFTERPTATRESYHAAEARSVAAMAAGAEIIYQATFFNGTFLGHADFLRRVERPSARWGWSYEVIDTKLALSDRPYFLVQLCNYSEHVERLQGAPPEHASIVLGSGDERPFKVAEYAPYYRNLKAAYVAALGAESDAYPFECAHCDLCSWRDVCAGRRDADDHLSLVAGIRRDQIRKLEAAGIPTLGALAAAPDAERPPKLAAETFANLRSQAAEQHRYRRVRAAGAAARHSYSFRELPDPHSGFARLPPPDPGDIFFDIEGDPMYRADRALEYLFGVYLPADERYIPFWGTDPAAERVAFEAFVDFVTARQCQYSQLHIYHYAPYETTALKRLMGRFASREAEIDGFLSAGTFVDLYPVVKQSVWISQPSYSIKKVEALYGFGRQATTTRAGDDSIVMFENWLETHDPATLEDIRAYNEDDCRSTYALREWLVRLRAERSALSGTPVPWRAAPADRSAPPSAERSALEATLLAGVPVPDTRAELYAAAPALRARWLLGNLLNYHRREQKPEWWEHFNRLADPSALTVGDTKSLGSLRYDPEIPPFFAGSRDQLPVHTFTFPDQEHEMRAGVKPLDAATGRRAGEIVRVDDLKGILQIKLAAAIGLPSRLTAIIPPTPHNDGKKRSIVEKLARAYTADTLERDHPATLALLLGQAPQLKDRPRGARIQPPSITRCAISALLGALDESYLVIQGPPGSGKSTLGAWAIVDLLVAGKRVALAAHSHKALHTLLRKVEETAAARNISFRGCHKSTNENPDSAYQSEPRHGFVADAPTIAGYAGCRLVSATTFAWAEESQEGAFDVVVIDEAGQVSLADALVVSCVARNVVLLGDPQQLPQVSKGSHPVGTDVSVLEHVLGSEATIAPNRGVFLDRSYRMQPDIDAFVSSAFYDGRLAADELNAANAVQVSGNESAGPLYIPVEHDGNARRSREEAGTIVAEIVRLLEGGSVTLRAAVARPLTPADILVVAPYNAQRALITEELRARNLEAVRVGTVDKFQGQEAPVVFFSMTTSSAELAPRGLDFLLSPNRLNVAISRAQAVSVVISSPLLLASRAATIEHMRLLGLLCEYVEATASSASRRSAEEAARRAFQPVPIQTAFTFAAANQTK